MFIKSVSHNVKDVFLGSGWGNWMRVDMKSNKVINASFEYSPSQEKAVISKLHTFYKK